MVTASVGNIEKTKPSAVLRVRGGAIWDELHRHPFVQRVITGEMDGDEFKFFIEEDYKYLIEYARVLGYGLSRCGDLNTMQYFSELLQALLNDEIPRCYEAAITVGVDPSDLSDGLLAPTTQAYTDFLVRTASQGDFVELPAAILPCSWSYVEIGQALGQVAAKEPSTERQWMQGYASDEMVAMSSACRQLVDQSVWSSGERGMALATKAFITSSRYELAFWDAAVKKIDWTV